MTKRLSAAARKQDQYETVTLPEAELVARGERLAKKFKGNRCMNCANAYNFSPYIIGACKCRVAVLRRVEVDRRLYDIYGCGDIPRKSPWGLDKACERWERR